MVPRPRREHTETARRAGQSAYRTALDVVLTGVAVILPAVVTIYVLKAALDILTDVLRPVILLLEQFNVIRNVRQNYLFVDVLIELGIYGDIASVISELIAVALLVVLIVTIGSIARFQSGDRLIDYFDYVITLIPGIGTIYRSFRRMGDAMLEGDTEQFRSVKLVEFPHDDTYVIGFETAQSPQSIREGAEADDMVTLFIPLAPNPVMGGFLTHVPTDRVRDIDMSVEAGVRSIITSGIATDESAQQVETSNGENTTFGIRPDDIEFPGSFSRGEREESSQTKEE